MSDVSADRFASLEKRLGALETSFASVATEVGGIKATVHQVAQAVDGLRGAVVEREKPNYQLLALLVTIVGGGVFWYTREQDKTEVRLHDLEASALKSVAERAEQREQIVTQGERTSGVELRMVDGLDALDTALQREMRDLNAHQDDVFQERKLQLDELRASVLRLDDRLRAGGL